MKKLFLILFLCSFGYSQALIYTKDNKVYKHDKNNDDLSGDTEIIMSGVASPSGTFDTTYIYKLVNDSTGAHNTRINSAIQRGLDSDAVLRTYVDSKVTYVYRSADTTNSVATPVNLGGMNFAVVSGGYYVFEANIIYNTGATTTGLTLTVTTPTVTTLAAGVTIYGQAADAAAGAWHGQINSSGDKVTSTGVAVINVPYTAVIHGVVIPSANGTVWLQWCPEVAASATIKAGTYLRVTKIK